MGSFFKISQVIQKEFNQKLCKTEAPEEFLQKLIEDLESQGLKLRDKQKHLLSRKLEKENVWEDKLELEMNKLEEEMKNMTQKIETAKSRYNFYQARQKRMEAYKSIQEVMGQVEDVSRYEKVMRK
jgi:phage shock protein A